MRPVSPHLLVALVLIIGAVGCRGGQAEAKSAPGTEPSVQHLPAFTSQAELDWQLAAWRKQSEAERGRQQRAMKAVAYDTAAAPAPAAAGKESITNVQTAGVDEGGIVKRHGDHLVVLRRGRLFTMKIGGDVLAPVAEIDVFALGIDGSGTWYDEMLISGDTVAVIGYSHARGGTEIGLFDIAAGGRLAYRETHHLSGNDYYSSRNYASRLIGNSLIFYMPLHYSAWGDDGLTYPSIRRWHPDATSDEFQRILPANRIYRADAGLEPLNDGIALHSVTRCDLAAKPMHCEASGVLGPAGRVFYVSADAVYVWTIGGMRGRHGDQPAAGMAVRLPLDGSAPTGLRVRGAPIDQMSFLQDAGGHLNVLLQSEGHGEAMWMPKWGQGRMALLRVPLARFGDDRAVVETGDYRVLPPLPAGNRQNRFIGDWLVYGTASRGEAQQRNARAYALRYAADAVPVELKPGHGVERIEAMGNDAVLIGNLGDELRFTSLALRGRQAGLRDGWRMPGARQGESRTHGFFYRRDAVEQGIVGLPVLRDRGEEQGVAVTYLRNKALIWRPLGELVSQSSARDDGCIASCVDWYGDARPIFIGPRVFALMGYELVEGRIDERGIRERRRIDFSPAPALKIGRD